MRDFIKKYYIYLAITVIAITIILLLPLGEEEQSIAFEPITTEDLTEEPEYIYIDIKGQVQNPGVYKVLKDSRLFQLVSLAGGTTGNADTLAINLSLKLYDQQVVYIPSYEDSYPIIIDVIENNSNGIININSASLELLDTLPGIGPSTAQSIIDYRTEIGFFESIEDIMSVTGIGEATFNDIKDLITV
ncbi:MAG: ComE operon protein 1 [Candidatus Izimaplasma bacterium HR2]|nr:MAG: ComE operon protein 1 [Candidatus Izimaplasma bacterium HR2]